MPGAQSETAKINPAATRMSFSLNLEPRGRLRPFAIGRTRFQPGAS
jgi:hypothetical protein